MSGLTPEQAVDRLDELHSQACDALRAALARFTATGVPPTPQERAAFRYPELKVEWQPSGAVPFTWRAWAKFQVPGSYATTVTHPAAFRPYLLEQLSDRTGGLHFRVRNAAEAQDAVVKAGQALRDEYLIGYHPPDSEPSGKYRRDSVKSRVPKVNIHARNGYYTP